MQEESANKNRWGDKREGSVKKNLRFPDDLVEKIDAHRKEESFASWVKSACLEKLEK